jgi:DNA-binding HxlR family transcriptional regulator
MVVARAPGSLPQRPLRFHDLEAGLAGVAPNTLSARLKTLEKQGVIGRGFMSNIRPG